VAISRAPRPSTYLGLPRLHRQPLHSSSALQTLAAPPPSAPPMADVVDPSPG
uniref:Uncharacterized protein n=3 Tax=Triticinae TaxID=1648030 RepID=A0A453SQB6_AEGTS